MGSKLPLALPIPNTSHMKTQLLLITLLLLLAPTVLFAQLTYLGEDKAKGDLDGYRFDTEVSNVVERAGKYYFTTGNSAIFETDGTMAGTRQLFQLSGNHLSMLAATEKYLYFSMRNNILLGMRRLIPEHKKPVAESVPSNEPGVVMSFNSSPVNRNRVDNMFISLDKKKIFFRRFNNDKSSISYISDSAPDKNNLMVLGYFRTKDNPDMAIWPITQVAFNRDKVFYNGYERSILDRQNTTAAFTSASLKEDGKSQIGYYISDYYHTWNKGYDIKPGFLSSGGELYSLVQKVAQPNENDFMLMRYDGQKVTVSVALTYNGNHVYAEVHDDKIYLIRKGEIFRFEPAGSKLVPVLKRDDLQWLQIHDGDYLVKAGGKLMARTIKGLLMIDEATGTATELPPVESHRARNNYIHEEIYVYGGKTAFYMTLRNKNFMSELVRFDPITKVYMPIEFPLIKNLKVDGVNAISQLGDRFVLLACYKDKKYKASYHMFMYRE